MRKLPRAVGPGVDHLRFTVTDDKDAYLLLKLARPWEGGETGTYHSYIIKMENDKIADVACRERLFHKDFTFVAGNPEKNEATGEKVRFVASVPKDWEYENIADQDMLGLKVRPGGKEGYGRIGHLRDGVAVDPGENVKKIMIYKWDAPRTGTLSCLTRTASPGWAAARTGRTNILWIS